MNGSAMNGTVDNSTAVRAGDTLRMALTVVSSLLMCFVMLALGCSVCLDRILQHLKRPWAGLTVGFVCQFGVMPLAAFALARGLRLGAAEASAVLILGCCPGGLASNLISYWLDGDMDLSISMTVVSTLLGLGMMPLCLYIYSRSWLDDSTFVIPYNTIGITLALLVIPVILGMLLRHKCPAHACRMLKLGTVVGSLVLVVTAALGIISYNSLQNMSMYIWFIAAALPLIGFLLGYVLAILFRQPPFRCRTISVETGAQSIHLCSGVLQISFPPEQLALMFSFPIAYSVFQLVYAILMITGYQIYKRQRQGQVSVDQEAVAPNLVSYREGHRKQTAAGHDGADADAREEIAVDKTRH
ncbi:unnamed protein product [Lampetra planeri]